MVRASGFARASGVEVLAVRTRLDGSGRKIIHVKEFKDHSEGLEAAGLPA